MSAAAPERSAVRMDDLVSLCARRGFIFQIERDLRRHQRLLGLRPARRRAQEQPEGALVAARGARARRRRGHRQRDHRAPAHLGSLGPRRALQRPDGRLPRLQEALPRRPARRRRPAAPRARAPREHDFTEARNFNLMLKTLRRRVGGRRERRLSCAPRPASSIFTDFKRVRESRAPEDPVRHRADRQGVPQRDQPAQLHLPLARVRAGGARVLLPPVRAREVVRALARASASRFHRELGFGEHAAARAPARTDELAHYAQGGRRHRVPVPVRLAGDRGHPRPRRLGSHAATASSRART